MREILFRGKRRDNGEWETGSFVGIRIWCSDARTYIADKMTGYNTPVIPETVGQYTGLTDKNGKKIFEHDLLKDEFGFIHEVYFDDGCFMRKLGLKSTLLATTHQVFEVVGNTFDNPELLKINNKLWSESI